MCVVSLVGRHTHSTCEVSACPHIMDEGSYMCHNCQGSGSLALGPSCSSMLYVAGLVIALRGGAPMVGAIPALVRVYGCRHPGARHWESSHQSKGCKGLMGHIIPCMYHLYGPSGVSVTVVGYGITELRIYPPPSPSRGPTP